MRTLLSISAMLLVWLSALPARALQFSAFPKIPHVVRDACIVGENFYFLTDHAVLQGNPNKEKWDLHPTLTSPSEDKFWSMKCAAPMTVTYVRAGVWRSTDPTATVRNKTKLPRGSAIDNWTRLANGDIAVLRDRHLEIFTSEPKWKRRQRLPGGGLTTQCAEAQNKILSSIGEVACRHLAPIVWQDRLLVPHNKLLIDQVLSQVPMIEHSELYVMQWDAGLESYQPVGTLGPLPGELAAYFIDKNPADGRETLFLVVLVRSGADAWGGLTHYSVLVPVTWEQLPKSNAQ